ncbi:hypothetical protein CBR_g8210 [Chara braunii]|uniref:X8 domain-containing protein n=1 Tax=Chara braunii TaxID=69332 RepID=A0A388KLH6_CHABU|nr:hypothetical protein CBR_g8210 [Chara braunii]|eukprot:GBG70909.1 hypothetical protein CBR_g8210 [Chara braunii]
MSLSVFNVTYPPSSGMFNESYLPVIKGVLDFLNSTGSSFMVNAFPFLPTKEYPSYLPLALGDPEAERVLDNGLEYTNMVDMMVNAVAYALEREGFSTLPISIGAVGWPTEGDLIATAENAEKFNNYLVGNLVSGRGTPKRPGAAGQMQAFVFELLDEDNKTVTPENYLFESHWGIRFMNGTAKYQIDLSQGWAAAEIPAAGTPATPLASAAPPSDATASPASLTPPITTLPSVPATLPPLPGVPVSVPSIPANVSLPTIDPACVPGSRGGYPASANPAIAQTGGPATYCVANDCASDAVIESGLRWVCGGTVGLDCSPIQPGGPCYVNSTVARASWAFNLRYVNQSRVKGSCYFGGSGMIIDLNPSLGTCIYP